MTDGDAIVHVPCPACGGDRCEARYEKQGYTVAACVSCGLHHVNPRPTAGQLARFYREQYFAGAESGSVHVQHRDMKLGSARLRLAVVREYCQKGSLLDIGCGGGLFVQAAAEDGWAAVGMDPSPDGLRIARRGYPARLVAARLEQAPFRAACFDVLTALDVLEHVFSPEAFLRAARELLVPDGVMLIETPNMAGLLPRLLGSRHPWVRPPEHLTFFTAATLRLLLERTGFRVERLQRIAWKVLSADYVLSLTGSTNPRLTGFAELLFGPFPALRRRPFKIPMDMLIAVVRR